MIKREGKGGAGFVLPFLEDVTAAIPFNIGIFNLSTWNLSTLLSGDVVKVGGSDGLMGTGPQPGD